MDEPPPDAPSCCGSEIACVFSKALLARAAVCELASQTAVAERVLVECHSPDARADCGTLAALLHERSRFALRLPRPGRPLMHIQALRLQCGGAFALKTVLGCERADLRRMVVQAQQVHGSLGELPWSTMVEAVVAWQPPRRSRRGGS